MNTTLKATMRVTEIENNKAEIEINFSGDGWNFINKIDNSKNMFSDCVNLGMTWNENEKCYKTIIDLTPEKAAPFVKYAENKKIQVVPM